MWKFHVDWVTPVNSTFNGPTAVSRANYNPPVSVPQPAGDTLDSLGDRMQMQAQYRNLGGTESLWVDHTVRTGGIGSPNGLQWAQINVTGGTIATTPVQQQIYGNVGGDGHHRWMGSLAVDGAGQHGAGLQRVQLDRSSRQFATTAGWPAIHSARCRRARRRFRRAAAPRAEASTAGATTAR